MQMSEPRHETESDQFMQRFPEPVARAWIYCGVVLLFFGLTALIWSIPFPQLQFLGAYNGFINWASFFITAAVCYYYFKAPAASYGVLLLVFAISYLIVSLEHWRDRGDGPALWLAAAFAIFLAAPLIFMGAGKNKHVQFGVRDLLAAPLSLFSFGKKKI